MTDLKTKPTTASVSAFLATIADSSRRADCRALAKLMTHVTGDQPKMWGASMVGFGHYRYRYATGHSGESFLTGFSPRKAALVIYITSGFDGQAALLKKLGRHKASKTCLYVKKLADVDDVVLAGIIRKSVSHMRRLYPGKDRG